jgi:hypothetical protein
MTHPRSTDPPIDPRGARFAAWVSTAVLVTGSAVVRGRGTYVVNEANTERGAVA